MKTIVFLAILGLCAAAPAPQFDDDDSFEDHKYEIIPILRFDEENFDEGGYRFLFETENGILREQEGRPLPDSGSIAKTGSWSYNLDDGSRAEFNFVADQGGFQVNSPLLPALPDFVLEQIAKAERDRAAGIIHDGQWHPELYNDPVHDGQWKPEIYN